ncbi:hypothetical protein LEN26_002408 [Aphanomyces euteiches]|nr:hypothetical protein AeMF1_013003 [Aphanomyces euteiches]KAH9159308.1 hypothetical protein LEN26_002408 [Aphanomyces euteiches]KAH9182414.1 hypothetical protein AeNC1_015611 [Aphanomyces euteiches]
MSRETISRLIAASTEESNNLHRANLLFEQTVREVEDADPMDVPSAFDTPILDSYMQAGSEALLTLTNFTMTEFNILCGLCEEDVQESWYDGRGRQNSASAKDAFFMLLVVMKHYDTWERHALDFNFRTPTFEKLIMRIMALVEPILT